MSRTTLAVVLFLAAVGTAEAQKKRVAVMNFDYATVQSGVNALFGANKDIGKGIADLLVDKLVQDSVFSVIERKELDRILAEQNFSNSDRADASTAAKIARVLGVDAIIIGSITQFGRDDKKTDIGGGALDRVAGGTGLAGLRKTKSTAVVQITARMINTTTAEILASVTAKGDATRSGTGLLGSGGNVYGTTAGAGIDMGSRNFADTIIGEATTKTVTDLARQLEARASSLPTTVVQIDGLVADAAPDGTLIINVGSKAGVKVGDKLEVKRRGREIRDPATGKVLRHVDDPIGTIAITEVEEQSAVGKFISAPASPAKVGDVVSTAK